MNGALLRAAVIRLSAAANPGARNPTARLRHAALELLLRLAFRRRSLPALLAALDGASVRAGSGDLEPSPVGLLRGPGSTCLYRSLAGYATLRARGEEVRFVIGVKAGPEIVAHAWLELGSEPVGEPADPRETFTVAYSHPPGSPGPQPEVNVASLRADPQVILTELQDGTGVLLHLGTKFYYALNRTGVVAWKLLSAGDAQDAPQLAHALSTRFAGVSVERARADVDALLGELQAEGLLSTGDAG